METLSGWVLGLAVLSQAAPAQRPGAEARSPLASGAVREIHLASPEGSRIEYFRLGPSPGRPGDAASNLAVLRTGPGSGAGISIELELRFPVIGTSVRHVEVLGGEERRLVWREIRPAGGRTVLCTGLPGDGLAVSETVGGEIVRRDLEHPEALFPLHVLELVRSGVDLDGTFELIEPLAGGAERVELSTATAVRVGTLHGASFSLRVLSVRGAGGIDRRFVFTGSELLAFALQPGGPWAVRIPAEEHRALSALGTFERCD